MGIGEHITGIIDGREAGTNVPSVLVHAVEQFRTLDASANHVVVAHHRTEVEVVAQVEEETRLEACLPSFHVALVAVVIAHVISHAPELAGEGIEIDGVVGTILVLWKDMRASDAQHIETYGADIAKEGYIGWRKKRVIGVGTVKTGCHESNAQLGVGAVVWAANDTEVEFLLLFILVGIIEVVQESRQKRLFLGQSILLCGGFVHPRRVCLHIARRNGDITEFGLACFYG